MEKISEADFNKKCFDLLPQEEKDALCIKRLKELENRYRDTYMFLGRLKSDNEYFLGAGNRCERHLWALNVKDQIREMRTVWNQLPDDAKPEWLSKEDIDKYEKDMILEN